MNITKKQSLAMSLARIKANNWVLTGDRKPEEIESTVKTLYRNIISNNSIQEIEDRIKHITVL